MPRILLSCNYPILLWSNGLHTWTCTLFRAGQIRVECAGKNSLLFGILNIARSVGDVNPDRFAMVKTKQCTIFLFEPFRPLTGAQW